MLFSADDGGVETAEEATEPAEPDINELCKDMFYKMAIFLQGELTGVCFCYTCDNTIYVNYKTVFHVYIMYMYCI